jgi:hypothetical protein
MAVDVREKARQLANDDVEAAFSFAKNIKDDWYRVQALAGVAWVTRPRALFNKIVAKALKDARTMSEPNRSVSCSAWVVRAMAERKDVELRPVVDDLLAIIDREPNPVRRSDALLLLFEAVYNKTELRDHVLRPLLSSCLLSKSWKKQRTLQNIALILAIDDPEGTKRVVELIGKETTKQKVIRSIEKREWLGPNEFFPHYTKAPS